MAARSDSRYEDTPGFSEYGDAEPFKGTRARDIRTESGVLEHVWLAGDRLDLVAANYYGDPRKWWLILDANPEIIDAGELSKPEAVGGIVLIPRDTAGGTSP